MRHHVLWHMHGPLRLGFALLANYVGKCQMSCGPYGPIFFTQTCSFVYAMFLFRWQIITKIVNFRFCLSTECLTTTFLLTFTVNVPELFNVIKVYLYTVTNNKVINVTQLLADLKEISLWDWYWNVHFGPNGQQRMDGLTSKWSH